MSKNSSSTGIGITFIDVLAIVFIVLKLVKVINWSWWWVLSPIWIPIALIIVWFIISAIIACIILK